MENAWRRWAVTGRVLTLLLVIGLGAASVLGYLQNQPYYAHRLGWGVEIDPMLRDAALHVAKWHEDGLVTGEEHWYNTSPDAINYFAWFCADGRGRPIVHGFVDVRLALFRPAMDDYVAVERSLMGKDLPGELSPGQEPPPPAWRKVLANREVRFLAFHANDLPSWQPMLQRLYSNTSEWQPCYVGGRTALFEWRDPQKGNASPFETPLAVDFSKRAFGPTPSPPQTPSSATPDRCPGGASWPRNRPQRPPPARRCST